MPKGPDPDGVFRYETWAPEGVEYLTLGGSCYIGIVDEDTILKYPRELDDEAALADLNAEAQMYRAIGFHKHIIGFKGQLKEGLLLERARAGSIAEYLANNSITEQQRFTWARQATEAIIAVHEHKVLHRDLNANNFLLDENLNIKLCDFQGQLHGPDGDVVVQGSAMENVKSSMPRAHYSHASVKTDIFALGSAFFYIFEGQEPFPELDSFDDEDEIVEKFKAGEYPNLHVPTMNRIIHQCWAGQYESANSIIQDLNDTESCIAN